MPTMNRIASVFQSPSPSLGGGALGTGDVNGHGFVECQPFLSGNGDNRIQKTGEWSGYSKPPGSGTIISINLKFDWEYDMNLSYSVSVGAPGFGGAFGLIESDYSINGGSSWSLAGSAFALRDVSNVDDFQNFHASGSENIVIPASTPFNLIRVRSDIDAEVQISGDDGGSSGNSQVNYRMQNIRLEVLFTSGFVVIPSNM